MKRESRTSQLKESIEQDIISGRLKPGDPLDENALALQFGVSKTPIREALLQLCSLGLVDFKPRHGAFVAKLTIRQLVGMIEVMAELEALSAQLAARRMDLAERRALSAIHERSRAFVSTGNVTEYERCNLEFHEAIYSGSHNAYLEHQLKEIRGRLAPYRRLPFQQTGQMHRSFSEHAAIASAIINGDHEAALREMNAHVTTGGHLFADVIAASPETADDLKQLVI